MAKKKHAEATPVFVPVEREDAPGTIAPPATSEGEQSPPVDTEDVNPPADTEAEVSVEEDAMSSHMKFDKFK